MNDSTQRDAVQSFEVFIVEDHPIARLGLKQLIEMEPDLTVCGEAEGISGVIERMETVRPDVALIDLVLNDGDGIEVIKHLNQHWVGVRMIVVSSCDAAIYAPIVREAGAVGYVNKHEAIDRIVEAIRTVLDGGLFFGRAESLEDPR